MAKQLTPEQQKALKEKLAKMSPEQIQELIKKQCVFCKIVKGEIPAYKVYEDEDVLAFLDINPANPGHTLVIPKEHYSVFPQMPDDKAAHLFAVVKNLSAVVFEVMEAEGVNILQNNGQIAGQAVPHIHVHIIPRFSNDKLTLTWEPKKLSEKEFETVQKAIASMSHKAKPTPMAKKETKPAKPEKKKKGKVKLYRFPRVP